LLYHLSYCTGIDIDIDIDMASSIPTTQTAAWLEKPQPGARFQIRNDIEVPTPGEGDVLVKLEYTGFW
jgi:NADPH:quinone reductase-like Zn-dependent oxidoreductase